MCDYSLMHVDNRLARQGEELATHRFGTGAIGLASASELKARAAWQTARNQQPKGVVDKLKQKMASNTPPTVCAICIPPGAELTLTNIPANVRQECSVSATERVTFDQLSARVNNYRDAFRFNNGKAVLIQNFGTGVKATVLSLEHATEREAVEEVAYAAR
jgi:hypothetical protein